MFKFQQEKTFKERKAESNRILKKYPGRIPIICEKMPGSNIQELDKKKYLVPADLTIGQFSCCIRKRLKITKETAIFLIINNTYPSSSSLICDLYKIYKNEDGFMYICFSPENTFGF